MLSLLQPTACKTKIKFILILSGIFLIVVLLGYGLVNIPKIMITNTNYEFKLEFIILV